MYLCPGGGCSQEFVAKLPVPRKLYFDKNIQSPKDIIPGDCVTPQSHKVSGVPTTTHRNSRLVACCHDTLCFVYLRQEGLYRIMNLEKTMRAKGVVGFCHELRGRPILVLYLESQITDYRLHFSLNIQSAACSCGVLPIVWSSLN